MSLAGGELPSDARSDGLGRSATDSPGCRLTSSRLPRVGDRLLDRFRLEGELGSGSQGIVYLAWDEERQNRLALKVVRSMEALSVLKWEFRHVAGVAHPHLVTALELYSDEDPAFVTMPYVDGDRLDVVLAGDVAPETLSRIFAQLAEGVFALHGAGLVHRDLKPSNVLVSRDGFLRVIDFGLACPIHGASASCVGSTAYVAPECVLGHPPAFVSDWYSVGVMLFQALEGTLPFRGCREQVLEAKCDRPAPPLSQAARARHPALAQLAEQLLSRQPERRPTTQEISRALGVEAPPPEPSPSIFVGRQGEITALLEAATESSLGRPTLVSVTGPSGIGKTRLVREFSKRLLQTRPDWAIWASDCYEHERIAYNAWDPLLQSMFEGDELDHVLAELPVETGILSRAFQRHQMDALRTSEDEGTVETPVGVALGRVLERFSRQRPVLVVLDQLQWADEDSARLLLEAWSALESARLLVLLVCRDDQQEQSPFLGFLRQQRPQLLSRRLPVAALGLDLSSELLHALGGPRTLDAASAQGNPLVLELMAREATALATLDQDARLLGAWISLAGHPVEVTTLQRVAESVDLAHCIRQLEAGGWVRSIRQRRRAMLVSSHDWTRTRLLEEVPSARIPQYHDQLGRALALSGALPEEIAEHFYQARSWADFLPWARRAVGRARAQRAYANEARWLERVLSAPGGSEVEKNALVSQTAAAWGRAGYGRRAASHYVDLAHHAPSERGCEFRLQAALQYLRCDERERGLAELDRVLAELGIAVPRSRLTLLFGLLTTRARLKRRPLRFWSRSNGTPHQLLCLEALAVARIGYRHVDMARAAYFTSRSLLLALSVGDERHVLAAAADEAQVLAMQGVQHLPRIEALFGMVDGLVRHTKDPGTTAHAALARAAVALFLGDFAEAAGRFTQLEQTLRTELPHLTWEAAYCRMCLVTAEQFHGGLVQLRPRLDEWISEAERRNDLAALRFLLPKRVWTLLATGQEDEAWQLLAQAEHLLDPSTPKSRLDVARVHLLFQRAFLLLCGAGEPAQIGSLRADFARFRRSSVRRSQGLRVTALALEAAVVLARRSSSDLAANEKYVVTKALRRLYAEGVGYATAYADGLAAALEHRAGRTQRALELLARSLAGFRASGMCLAAASIRLRIGQLRGGAPGRKVARAAADELRERGIADPVRFAGIHAAGFGAPFGEQYGYPRA